MTPSIATDRLPQMGTEILPGAAVGARVVVRYLIDGGRRATDALGELAARTPGSVTVRTRGGPVTIEVADVVAAKAVPEAPTRRWRVAPFLRRAGVAVLALDCLRAADGSADEATASLVGELVSAGVPVRLWAQDGPRARRELERLGLSRLAPLLLAPAGPGTEDQAYAAAHADVEERLGRAVGRAHVHLVDPRPAAVDGARAFGWQARVFTAAP